MFQMSNNIYGRKEQMPASNIALMVISIVCVVAAVIVFFFFNRFQKLRYSGEAQSVPTASAGTEPVTTPEPVKDVIVASGSTLSERFNKPADYAQTEPAPGSFAEYLKNFPLRDYSVKPLIYDSDTQSFVNYEDAPSVSVLAQDLINKADLQRGACSIIRLYAEYLYASGRYSDIKFNLLTTPLFSCDYTTWTNGGRLTVNADDQISWCTDHNDTCGHRDVETGVSDSTFRYYLQNVMMYSNNASLVTVMDKVDLQDAAAGDVIVYAESEKAPSVIMDMAVSPSGEKIFIMAQGGIPACEIYIVRNESDADLNPWHRLSDIPLGASIYRFK